MNISSSNTISSSTHWRMGVLSDVLAAMKQGRAIAFTNRSGRTGNVFQSRGLPLKIFVSTRTGRRYVCLYQENTRRFTNMRLTHERCDAPGNPLRLQPEAGPTEAQSDRLWGVSFSGSGRLEEICIKFYVNESTETYVLDRLYREGRGGEIQRIRENEYLYSGAFFDTNEMLPWVKTFTGRILDIQGSNHFAVAKITYDWEKCMKCIAGTAKRAGGDLMAAELFDKICGATIMWCGVCLRRAPALLLTRRDMDAVCGAYSYRGALTIVPQAHRWRLGAVLSSGRTKTYAPVLHHPDQLKPPPHRAAEILAQIPSGRSAGPAVFHGQPAGGGGGSPWDAEALYDPGISIILTAI